MTYANEEAGRVESRASDCGMDDGYVYFAGAVGGSIKIGRSVRPRERLNALQVGSELKLQLLAIIPGGRELEAALHTRFAPHRIRGEIFAASPELLMLIWEAAKTGLVAAHQPPPASVHRFLTELTRRVPSARLRSSALFACYRRWATTNGERVLTQTAFGMGMRSAGFESLRSNGMHWLGIRLREEVTE